MIRYLVLFIHFSIVSAISYSLLDAVRSVYYTPILGRAPKRCYGEYGCITNDARFQTDVRPLNPFPHSPKKMSVDFLLYTRSNPEGPQLLEPTLERIRSTYFRIGMPVKFIIHGWLDNGDAKWVQLTIKEHLKREDLNIIVVDWRIATWHVYSQAAANVRLMGLMIAKYIKLLQESFSVPPEIVHLIGHSFGAQAAGHAGKEVKNLGRITGLDPTQLLYEGTHPDVHLDFTDALFVDVIHSDSRHYARGGLSFGPPCGHVDFYPNGGISQSECRKSVIEKYRSEDFHPSEGTRTAIACDHGSSLKLYAESIQSSCSFLAVQCSSYMDYRKGRCFNCGSKGEKCAPLGYNSEQWFQKFESKIVLPVKMFLMTGTEPPFCRYHHRIKITTADFNSGNSIRGRLLIQFSDSRIHLNRRNMDYRPATTYMFIIVSRSREPINNFELEWQPTRQPMPHVFSNNLEISSIEMEGLELRYRCIFSIDIAYTQKNSVKTIQQEKCEDLIDDDQKILLYPLPESEIPINTSSNALLKKRDFTPKPTIIPQPLFRMRNEAASYIFNPVIERLFSKPS